MTTADKTLTWVGIIANIAQLIFIALDLSWWTLVATGTVAVATLSFALWKQSGRPVGKAVYLISVGLSISVGLIGWGLIRAMSDAGDASPGFSVNGVAIDPLQNVQQCSTRIAGRADLGPGDQIWVAQRAAGSSGRFFYTRAVRDSASSDRWAASMYVGVENDAGVMWDFYAFRVTEEQDTFLTTLQSWGVNSPQSVPFTALEVPLNGDSPQLQARRGPGVPTCG
jgi:hypothetical protein